MNLAEQAIIERHNENAKEADKLFAFAYEYESLAARVLAEMKLVESLSILQMSAAQLAIDCDNHEGAKYFIEKEFENSTVSNSEQLEKLIKQVNDKSKGKIKWSGLPLPVDCEKDC